MHVEVQVVQLKHDLVLHSINLHIRSKLVAVAVLHHPEPCYPMLELNTNNNFRSISRNTIKAMSWYLLKPNIGSIVNTSGKAFQEME